jgi:hypothetical protein
VAAHELLVLTGFGVGAGTEKQHMLEEMGHALAIGRIVEVAGIHRQEAADLSVSGSQISKT